MEGVTKVNLLIISLLIPTTMSLNVLGMRLSMYRIILLLVALPLFNAYFTRTKKHPCDKLVFGLSFWMFISFLINHGQQGLEPAVIVVIETLLPYLMVRVYLTDEEKIIRVIKVYLLSILFLPMLTIPENLYGFNLLGEISGGGIQGEQRLGLYRAKGPFDHPILLAIYCGIGLVLAEIFLGFGKIKKGIIIIATLSALSSIGFILVGLQVGILKMKRYFKYSVKQYLIIAFTVYILVEIFAQSSALSVVFRYLTLNPQTGYFRLLIWEYGMDNVFNNPWFGLAFNDWVRPSWMPYSIDSFWLVIGVKHGVPPVLFLISILWIVFRNVNKRSNVSTYLALSFFVFCVGGLTVHFWNSAYILFFIMLGLNVNAAQVETLALFDKKRNGLPYG